MGELMRRFWQPVLAGRNVTTRPREVRILGEDLIVFRDGEGGPGCSIRAACTAAPACCGAMSRPTDPLLLPRVEVRVEGHCLEQPCEPNPRQCRPEHRQPWYPVREHYGLVWAYMGPPERMPAIPRFDCMEPLEHGEDYLAFDNSLGSHGDVNGPEVVPYSWLHMNDNVMDPFHVQVLHTTFSGTQFVREFEVMPTVRFDEIGAGVTYTAHRDLADGRSMDRVSTWLLPNVMCVPRRGDAPGPPERHRLSVPVDDSHAAS
jgi:phenylpropionate dioxygenase-like ring-hydroxylating dioxygenase large terminal subunit